jgi:hypothetical protein
VLGLLFVGTVDCSRCLSPLSIVNEPATVSMLALPVIATLEDIGPAKR